MAKVVMCDPPGGWRYGFPRAIPEEVRGSGGDVLNKWLVECGYPENEIKKLGDYFYIRYWEQEQKKSCKN